jgi:N-acetylglutamate synthase-like GNAT family acetyltransferase
MPPQIKIEHLGEHRGSTPVIVGWLHAQWGHLMPGVSLEKLAEIYENRLIPHQIPETFVALRNGEIVGTASLVKHDMSARMDLFPWLAAVYIKAEHRGQGIGSKLVQAVMDEAKLLGLERFYLFTPNQASFYARLGWLKLEEIEYRGEQVTVMMYELDPN